MIAFLTLELHIEAAQSLKDKRQVVRSLKDRLRAHFNVAVAELDPSGLWNRATLGVVGISDSRDYLDGLMKNVERQATRIANNGGADVADSFLVYLLSLPCACAGSGFLIFSFVLLKRCTWKIAVRSTIGGASEKPCGRRSSPSWRASWATRASAWSTSPAWCWRRIHARRKCSLRWMEMTRKPSAHWKD